MLSLINKTSNIVLVEQSIIAMLSYMIYFHERPWLHSALRTPAVGILGRECCCPQCPPSQCSRAGEAGAMPHALCPPRGWEG